MPRAGAWSHATEAVGDAQLEQVMWALDLGEYPMKAVTIQNRSNTTALAAVTIETAPAVGGPWVEEDLSESALPTLAAGAAATYDATHARRWLRVWAKAATLGEGETCPVTVYVNAVG